MGFFVVWVYEKALRISPGHLEYQPVKPEFIQLLDVLVKDLAGVLIDSYVYFLDRSAKHSYAAVRITQKVLEVRLVGEVR